MLTPTQWQNYRDTINSVNDSFNQDTVTWKRLSSGLPRYGEDVSLTYTDIELNCLISYNIFRTWPMSDETSAGVLDKESMVMILNIEYLSNLGYINSDGYFDINPGKDKFTHLGKEYRSAGETPVAQAGDRPILIYIILKRQYSDSDGN